MGSHYISIHVRHADQRAVVGAVEMLVRKNEHGRVLVGPALNGWVGVYPNDALLTEEFSSTLSAGLSTAVLIMDLHDSSLILYNHFHSGKLVDEYSSDPDYFKEVSPADHERLKGRPGLFGTLVDSHRKVQRIASLLARERAVFEDERFEELAKLLGIQNASTSYDYLTHGDAHRITRRKEFIHVPNLTSEKAAAKAARAAVRAELKRLKALGVLCLDLKPKTFPGAMQVAFEPLKGGLLLNLIALRPEPGHKVFHLKPPWADEPEPLDLGPGAAPSSLVFSCSGKWLASHDGQMRVWDWRERKLLAITQTGFWPVQFSPDENLLLCRSENGFTVLSLQTGETLRSAPASASHPDTVAWHPDCRFVVIRPRQDQLGIVDLDEGQMIKVLYSGKVQDLSTLASLFSGTLTEAGFSERVVGSIAQQFIHGSDEPFNVRFSRDGRLLFCATTRGLRILEWEKVLEAEKATPPPLYATSPLKLGSPPINDHEAHYTDFTYDLALDEAVNRVLFSDIQGTVWFLNLDDKRSGALLKPPEKNSTWRILLSPDRQHLCCMSTEGNDKNGRIQVWNYQKLLETAG